MSREPPLPETSDTPDAPVWRALADPHRRRMLDLLRQHPRTTGDLAEDFTMSRYGVMKHLRVLHEAGLILIRRQGRERWNHLNPVPIRELYHRWIRPFEEGGADSLLRVRDLAETMSPSKELTMAENTTPNNANIELEITIAAPPEAVWKALTDDLGAWWPDDYKVRAGAPLLLEPAPGGRIYEDWGEGAGVCWGTVVVFDPSKRIQWANDLTADFGGPARTFSSYTLVNKEGGTLLQFQDTPFGHVTEKMTQDMKGGWQYLLQDVLKPYAEGLASP